MEGAAGREGQPSHSQRGCRWTLQVRNWEIAPPEEVSPGAGRSLRAPGPFLQLSVSPGASLCVLRCWSPWRTEQQRHSLSTQDFSLLGRAVPGAAKGLFLSTLPAGCI